MVLAMVDVSDKIGSKVVASKDGMESDWGSLISVGVVKSGWGSTSLPKKVEMQSRIHYRISLISSYSTIILLTETLRQKVEKLRFLSFKIR